jgi:ribosome-associated protein
MADIANNEKITEELALLIEEHKGENTVVLDVRERCPWTDYFVISTVRSKAHLGGLLRHLYRFLTLHGIEPFKKRKGGVENGWVLIDCGDFVVHLMTGELREFYELEKLWFGSRLIGHSGQRKTPV